jgi:5'-3' exonuclease
MRTALIDGDSIAYILGWNFRESFDENLMKYSVDNFINTTLELLEATHYIGALSSKPVFRDQTYKYARYKGTRGETHPDIERWKPFINNHLIQHWKFQALHALEADDVVAYHAYNPALGECIICSPDKDLRQIPGRLYNYNNGVMETITPEVALETFQTLMVCGDITDNIKGIPGLGPVKLAKKLQEGKTVYQLYEEYFGRYYGTIIHEETLCTVMPMTPAHPMISFFEGILNTVEPLPTPSVDKTSVFEDF